MQAKSKIGVRTFLFFFSFPCFSCIRSILTIVVRVHLQTRQWLLLDGNGDVLPTPVLVNVRVQLQLSHAETGHETHARDTEHGLPDNLERLAKRVPHLVLQRLLERWDCRNRRKGELDALRELREERCGQFVL